MTMTTLVHTRSAPVPDVVRQGAWFVAGSAVAFAIPYVGVSQLHLQHDVYHGAYFAATLALLATYARSERLDVRGLFTRHWLPSLVVAIPVAAFVVWNEYRTDDPLHSEAATVDLRRQSLDDDTATPVRFRAHAPLRTPLPSLARSRAHDREPSRLRSAAVRPPARVWSCPSAVAGRSSSRTSA